MRQRRETPRKPVVGVESAHRPEMLLHPREGAFYCQRLLCDHSDEKRAQGPNDKNKKEIGWRDPAASDLRPPERAGA